MPTGDQDGFTRRQFTGLGVAGLLAGMVTQPGPGAGNSAGPLTRGRRGLSGVGSGGAASDTQETTRQARGARVQELLDEARNAGESTLRIPDHLVPYDPAVVEFTQDVRLARQGTPEGVYDLTAYGADPAGEHDSAPAWETAVGSGRTLYVPPDAKLIADSRSFEIENLTDVVVEGGGELGFGPELGTSPGIDPILRIENSERVRISGSLTFRGTGNVRRHHNNPGVQILSTEEGGGTRDIEITGCRFLEFSTWGIRIQSDVFTKTPRAIRTQDVSVNGNLFFDCLGGIIYGSGAGAERVFIHGNFFRRMAQNAVKLDGQDPPSDGQVSGRVVVSTNEFHDMSSSYNPGVGTFQGAVVVDELVRGVEVTDNIFTEIDADNGTALWVADGAQGNPNGQVVFRENIMDRCTSETGQMVRITGSGVPHRDVVIEENVLVDEFQGSFVVNESADDLRRLVVRDNVLTGVSDYVFGASTSTREVVVESNVVGRCGFVIRTRQVVRLVCKGNRVVDGHHLVFIDAGEDPVDEVLVEENWLFQETDHSSTNAAVTVRLQDDDNVGDVVRVLDNRLGPNRSDGGQGAIFVGAGGARAIVRGNVLGDDWSYGVWLRSGRGEVAFNRMGDVTTDALRLDTECVLFANSIGSAGRTEVRNPGFIIPLELRSGLNFVGSGRDENDMPSTERPVDWVRVEVDGAPRFLPAYA